MVISAKYEGKCRNCGQKISIGEQINWERGAGATHVECPDAKPEPTAKATESSAPFELTGGSGYGCRGWAVGQVVHITSERLRARGYPEYVCVVTSKKRWVDEDGMSFGVGDDSGHLYWAKCREATVEEAAPLKIAEAATTAKKQRQAKLTEIKDMIRHTGEQPDGENTPDGERYHDTQNIYGGGDWFVVGHDWIWYVRNNGGDGDNWAANNVKTGGAGAIGWRIPFDRAIADEITKTA